MFKDFVPLQLKCLSEYSALIPGTLGIIRTLRKRGYKIGSTTGYMTEMMKINLRDAAKQGYVPDSTVCASEVPAGRPFPYMCLQNVMNLGVSPVEACVKIDDTRPGIEEGLNGGMWTIGLAISGNEIGLSLKDWKKLPKADQERMRAGAYTRMYQSGAHYVVDAITESCPASTTSRRDWRAARGRSRARLRRRPAAPRRAAPLCRRGTRAPSRTRPA